MDPFTPLVLSMSFGHSMISRILNNLSKEFDIDCSTPDSFDGLSMLIQDKTFMGKSSYADDENLDSNIDQIWDFFDSVIDYNDGIISENEFCEIFDKSRVRYIKGPKLSMALSWMRPDFYVPFDFITIRYLNHHLNFEIDSRFDGKYYLDTNEEVIASFSNLAPYDIVSRAWSYNGITRDVLVRPRDDWDPGYTEEQWISISQKDRRYSFVHDIATTGMVVYEKGRIPPMHIEP